MYFRNSVYMQSLSTYGDILCGLAVVLKDHCDVHVDDDEEAEDQVGKQVGDGHDGVPAVALIARLRVRYNTKVKLRLCIDVKLIFDSKDNRERTTDCPACSGCPAARLAPPYCSGFLSGSGARLPRAAGWDESAASAPAWPGRWSYSRVMSARLPQHSLVH